MKNENNIIKNENQNNTAVNKTQTDKTAQIKKKNQKAQLERFKSQYFDYYDDIKISDRQDW